MALGKDAPEAVAAIPSPHAIDPDLVLQSPSSQSLSRAGGTVPSRAVPPAASSLLDPEETSVGFDLPCITGDELERRLSRTLSFRHGWWRDRRGRTAATLRRMDGRTERVQRFETCGSNAWVLMSTDGQNRVRMKSNRCHDRWCEACQTERRRSVCRNLRDKLAGRELRLLTLTLKSAETPLREQLDRLTKSFRRLRQVRDIRNAMQGGMYFLEVTLNQKTRQWHPHLHIIWEGTYLHHSIIREEWYNITGDSYIVDVRPIKNSDHAASYVAKYAGKAVSHHVWTDQERFEEAIASLRGKRTFQTYGSWSKLDLSIDPDDGAGWAPVAPLWEIIDKASRGDRLAVSILSQLRKTNAPEPIDTPDTS